MQISQKLIILGDKNLRYEVSESMRKGTLHNKDLLLGLIVAFL